jgi:hypothetical protein
MIPRSTVPLRPWRVPALFSTNWDKKIAQWRQIERIRNEVPCNNNKTKNKKIRLNCERENTFLKFVSRDAVGRGEVRTGGVWGQTA